MKRTQKSHVRKFGGVWYQLVEATPFQDACTGCEYTACLQNDIFPNYECFQGKLTSEGIYGNGGIWKELGEI